MFKSSQLFVKMYIYTYIYSKDVCVYIFIDIVVYIYITQDLLNFNLRCRFGFLLVEANIVIMWFLQNWWYIYIYIHLYIYIRYVRACMKFCVYDGSGRCNSVCIYIVISHEYVMVIWKHTYPISYSFMNTYIYTLKRCIYIYM